jgi:endonuclease/exonuclease/phosphatase family metal-dependent hydrolase
MRALRWVAVTALAIGLTSSVPPAPARATTTFVVLQMNLCNSGMARSCYSFGKAVDEAVANIHRYRPQLVTLQEICRDDLYGVHGWGKLAQAMADLYGSRHIWVDFTPAHNRISGDGYRGCLNGEQYGVAMIHHDNGRDIHRGWYANQGRGIEQRAWTCTTVIKDRLTGCTTHLTINRDAAMRQCRELMSIMTSSWLTPEVIISGDFNLTAEPGKPQDVQNCAPPGYGRASDDALQQVFYTRNIQLVQVRHEPMNGTDHPLLYEQFRI